MTRADTLVTMRERQRPFPQPPWRPLELFLKPYSLFHGGAASMSRLDSKFHHDNYVGDLFPSFAEKCCPRVEKSRPGNAWAIALLFDHDRAAPLVIGAVA